jgi:tripartite-type tricarboxylate transporter receptor subunit TctC
MEKSISRRTAVSGLSAMVLGTALGRAQAQAPFPSKLIRMIVPWSGGGSGDVQTRIVTQRLSEVMGQTIMIDNKPGANGLLGTKVAIAAPADGYTMLFGVSGQISLAPLLSKEATFNPLTDLTPISGLSSMRFYLVVSTASGFQTINDIVAASKAKPGKINFGSTGVGAMSHIAGAQLAKMTGADMTHIPYAGGQQVAIALLTGDIHCTFVTGGDLSPYLKAGTMRAVAVTGSTRSKLLPDVLTTVEQGLTGWMPDNIWFAFFGPARMPQRIVDQLHAGIAKVLAEPEPGEKLNKTFFAEPWPVDGSELTKVLRTEKENLIAALKVANISAS